jgi:hypothetical protein
VVIILCMCLGAGGLCLDQHKRRHRLHHDDHVPEPTDG